MGRIFTGGNYANDYLVSGSGCAHKINFSVESVAF
jgi:hypothetical protein